MVLLQNMGGAILVGYNGNPEKSSEIFDSGQSATAILEMEEIVFASDEINNTFKELQNEGLIEMQLPFFLIYSFRI